MSPQTQTVARFYTAFAALDPDTMSSCYADDVQFDDAVFSLQGKEQVMGMWRMLCSNVQAGCADVWRLEFRDVQIDGLQARAHWEAWYRFSATGRMVHNSIDACMVFAPDGRIQKHSDRFNFWRWSRQALGAPGVLIGWTPLLRRQVRTQARRNLERFLAARASAKAPPA